MNNPCPICYKERGPVIGDFPRSYFCEGHAESVYTYTIQSGGYNKVIELLEKIIKMLDDIAGGRHGV